MDSTSSTHNRSGNNRERGGARSLTARAREVVREAHGGIIGSRKTRTNFYKLSAEDGAARRRGAIRPIQKSDATVNKRC